MAEGAEGVAVNVKKAAIVLVAAVAIGLFFALGLGHFLTLEALKANREALSAFYREHRLAMAAGFMTVYVVQTALSLPGAAILSLAAGAIFGVVAGTCYAVVSATIGATLAFLATRYLLNDTVQRKFGAKLEKLNRELAERGLNYLLFLRLVPVFPFFLINLGAGLTRLPLRTFVIGTAIGIIPGGFAYCNAGASLAAITSGSEIVSPRVLGSFALLGLFALAPVIYKRRKQH
jgi:uncharacterized membrane protein YdjX (TVP38/TMEM64 family)